MSLPILSDLDLDLFASRFLNVGLVFGFALFRFLGGSLEAKTACRKCLGGVWCVVKTQAFLDSKSCVAAKLAR